MTSSSGTELLKTLELCLRLGEVCRKRIVSLDTTYTSI